MKKYMQLFNFSRKEESSAQLYPHIQPNKKNNIISWLLRNNFSSDLFSDFFHFVLVKSSSLISHDKDRDANKSRSRL